MHGRRVAVAWPPRVGRPSLLLIGGGFLGFLGRSSEGFLGTQNLMALGRRSFLGFLGWQKIKKQKSLFSSFSQALGHKRSIW